MAAPDFEVNKTGTRRALDARDIEIQQLREVIEGLIVMLEATAPSASETLMRKYAGVDRAK